MKAVVDEIKGAPRSCDGAEVRKRVAQRQRGGRWRAGEGLVECQGHARRGLGLSTATRADAEYVRTCQTEAHEQDVPRERRTHHCIFREPTHQTSESPPRPGAQISMRSLPTMISPLK
jgi:hypothetical protein